MMSLNNCLQHIQGYIYKLSMSGLTSGTQVHSEHICKYKDQIFTLLIICSFSSGEKLLYCISKPYLKELSIIRKHNPFKGLMVFAQKCPSYCFQQDSVKTYSAVKKLQYIQRYGNTYYPKLCTLIFYLN